MDLSLLSAFLIAFSLTLYVLLDGFDLGVGILLMLQPGKAARGHMIDSITPTWDGNETWLVMAAITLFAAFPIAYSILLPAAYLPAFLMVISLGFRGVSFEFRAQSRRHRPEWDLAFAIGSLIAAFMQGLILGGVMQGIQVKSLRFTGSVLDIFRPLPLICGFALAAGYTVLGAGWLILKSNPSLQSFARRCLKASAPIFAILFGVACVYAASIQPGIRSAWTWHGITLTCLTALFAVTAATLTTVPKGAAPVLLFSLGLFQFVIAVLGLVVVVFPNVVPFRVSIWDAASSPLSQKFVLIGAAFVVPVILTYSAFAYWVFRGRTPEEGWAE